MKHFSLAGILVLGLVIRIVWLSNYPPGFTPDEAAFGYNAYSLLQTGRDEWGTAWYRLPFTNLKSFGDYKMPLYAFLTVPAVKLFGLNEYSTRLPNAIMGTLAILAVYVFAGKLSPKPKAGLFSAFLMAISPWSVQLSRGAFEANLVTCLLPLGISLFMSRRVLLAAFIFALNFYSYHSARMLTLPVLLISFFFTRSVRKTFSWLLLFTILILPGVWSLVGSGSARIADVGIFSPTDGWQSVAATRFTARAFGLPDILARFYSNKFTATAGLFIHNYLSYFSPQFLFTSGAGEGTYGILTGRGILYLIELPLLIIFGYLLVTKPGRSKYLLLLLLLLTPIPAALAKGPGMAANRAAPLLPFLIIAAGWGWGILSRNKSLFSVILVTVILSSVGFFKAYIFHSPSDIGQSMLYGRRELFTRIMPIAAEFSQVRFSRSLSEPHIFLAFYGAYPPVDYQAAAAKWPDPGVLDLEFLDQTPGYALGKYYFGDIHPNFVTAPILAAGLVSDFPFSYPEYFHINYPNGQPGLKVGAILP